MRSKVHGLDPSCNCRLLMARVSSYRRVEKHWLADSHIEFGGGGTVLKYMYYFGSRQHTCRNIVYLALFIFLVCILTSQAHENSSVLHYTRSSRFVYLNLPECICDTTHERWGGREANKISQSLNETLYCRRKNMHRPPTVSQINVSLCSHV